MHFIRFGKNKDLRPKVLFHTDTNPHGWHGAVNVSNKQLGIVETSVRFVFEGMATPPLLTPRTYNDIIHAAEVQGYIFHHIVVYGRDNEIVLEAGDVTKARRGGGVMG